uniref:PHD-type domain-containing protein n=1 Tax=Brassica oleracea var. oleracea TaxID=109376 RepID=A0A0D3BF39_BRAOL
MVSITHKDDQIVESKEITPIASPKNTYDTNSDELNDTDEEEVNVCNTCGVQGFTNKLAICDNCGVGAEHIYCCMAVELEDVPERWSCNDCVEMGEGGFRKQNDLSTQKSSVTVSLDLNIEPN